jgi:hypothetical protein
MYFCKKSKLINTRLFLFILFLSCLVLSGCRENVLFSSWRNQKITIDGKYKDWGAINTYYDEKTKVVLNLVNDADYFCVCLITRNREIEVKIMESGLILWFDRDNKKNKTFGIRFPIGLKKMGMSLEEKPKLDMDRDWRDQEDKSGLIDRNKEKLRDKDFNKHLETLEGLQEKIEIIEKMGKIQKKCALPKPLSEKSDNLPPQDFQKGGPSDFTLDQILKFGIEAKADRENDYFVYELKVPLAKSNEHPFAISIKNGEPFSLGVEIAGIDVGDGIDKGMPSPGGGRPGKGPPGGHPGSMSGGRDELHLWATVVLSSNL